MADTVQGRMARGALWMVLFKLVERSLGLVSTLILVRVLLPADFGIVAMATSFIAMAQSLTAIGFDIALIQDQQATEAHYSAAWTGNLLLGAGLTAVMLLMAAPIARFYARPEVFWVVGALAFGPLIAGAENIGVVAFRKDLDFRREFTFQISRKVVGFVVVVSLALWLRSYWALVAGMLTSTLAGTTMSYLAHPFRPRLSLARVGALFRFSRWLLLNNVVAFFKERSTDFFIGRLHGPGPLGVYNVSYELATMPSTELSAPINRALLPGFARLERADVRGAYRNALGLLALLALPAAAGIYALAPWLVPVVLGGKWLDAVPLMEVLAFNGALLLFHSSICSVLISRGHPDRVMMTNATYVVILVGLLALLSGPFGLVGATYAALAASVITTPIYVRHIAVRLGIGPGVFVRAIARPLLAVIAMAVVVRRALPAHHADMPAAQGVALLVGGVVMGAAVYAAVAVVLWIAAGRPDGPERMVIERGLAEVRRRFGGGR